MHFVVTPATPTTPATPRDGPETRLDLRTGDRDVADVRLAPGSFYYRSSLCSTDEGRPVCDAIERAHALELVVRHELPARPSMIGMRYDRDVVTVALYRVR